MVFQKDINKKLMFIADSLWVFKTLTMSDLKLKTRKFGCCLIFSPFAVFQLSFINN